MLLAIAILPGPTHADEVLVAVASNFRGTMATLAEGFEAATGHRLVLAAGSTGKHYAQIRSGAPFHAFFAADAERPRLLEQEGRALAGSRFTYALGALVLWSPRPELVDSEGRVLASAQFRRLAIANPELAPYGMAAVQVLGALGLDPSLGGRVVRGENIAQAFQFVRSGNAELGFIARSQWYTGAVRHRGSAWPVPPALHAPIRQQAVLLTDRTAARALLEYVRGEEALRTIEASGYLRP